MGGAVVPTKAPLDTKTEKEEAFVVRGVVYCAPSVPLSPRSIHTVAVPVHPYATKWVPISHKAECAPGVTVIRTGLSH